MNVEWVALFSEFFFDLGDTSGIGFVNGEVIDGVVCPWREVSLKLNAKACEAAHILHRGC